MPHRLGFSAAALVLACACLWWLAWLLARAAGLAWPWAVPPGLAHGLLFGFGFMPLFFAGFLFTAGPKWLRVAPLPARALRVPVGLQTLGWLVFMPGVHGHAWLAAFGIALAALAWLRLVGRLAGLLRRSAAPGRVHLRLIAAASWLGGALQLAAAAALAAGRDDIARAVLQLGLWGFVAPVFVTALHRMLPVFDDDVAPRLAARAPHWLLATLLALCLLQGLFALAEPWPALRIGVDGAAALLLLALAARWLRLQGGARLRLIVMLQAGIVWLAAAFALAALGLPRAAQHAFAAGFLATMMMAMVTRVASGQAGRSIAADGPAWALFVVLQAAALLRVAAALAGEPSLVLVLAAVLFALAMLGWAARLWAWQRPRRGG
ncbi:NnrS family protein [Piscinibacter sp.]|uniref:NnrS family protein n=1 Tax=Piscinibacter sp. TaxID=1903157 RepID=UPI0039E6BED4